MFPVSVSFLNRSKSFFFFFFFFCIFFLMLLLEGYCIILKRGFNMAASCFGEISHSKVRIIYYTFLFLLPVWRVKRKAMIRNWYNQIPYPALKTKREITKYIKWQQFTKGRRAKPNEQLFPQAGGHYVTHIIGKPNAKRQLNITLRKACAFFYFLLSLNNSKTNKNVSVTFQNSLNSAIFLRSICVQN